jgi:polar amino acid transport system permease protein
MVEFTLWDIVRNLLLALRWTVALSAIAFIGGGLVGGLLLSLRLAWARARSGPSRSTCSSSRARRC